MSTGIFLSYKGLGANLLHLSYCHEIAKKIEPVEIITLSNNLSDVIENDPLIKKVIYLDKYHKKITDIIKLSNFLKEYDFKNFFIFYPSIRFLLAAKLAGIDNIFTYPLLKKKNLHLVNAAKTFTENNLNIKDCPTETTLFIDNNKKKIATTYLNKNKKNIIIGAGSSGPTTKWGTSNYIELIHKLKEKHDCYFIILGGPAEKEIADKILSEIGKENGLSVCEKKIGEIIPIISVCNLYIGNDSFGHHVASQSSVPSIILLLDTPPAYSVYSKHQYQISPDEICVDDISHDSTISPDRIKVENVLKKALSLLI